MNWESVADKTNNEVTVDDLQAAAYRLVAEQVVYHNDRPRYLYPMIERFEREFMSALEIFGIDLVINRRLRYACAIPRHAKTTPVSQVQTLLALVLRQIYDEHVRSGQITDDGEIIIDSVEFEEKYGLATKREFPAKGELDSALKVLRRWGIARKADEVAEEIATADSDAEKYLIAIRPAITEVLGETALHRLAAWRDAAPGAPHADDDIDQGGGE